MQFHFRDTSLLSEVDYAAARAQLMPFLNTLSDAAHDGGYQTPFSVLHTPNDAAMLEGVRGTAGALVNPELTEVILVGIGGPALGAQALHQVRDIGNGPRLTVLDTLDPKKFALLIKRLAGLPSPQSIAVVVGSKSGTTFETAAQWSTLWQALTARFGLAAKSRIIAVSDEGSPLAAWAKEENVLLVRGIPAIGGRYSVTTPFGLVPLALLGFDVTAFMAGAADMTVRVVADDDTNPAMAYAAVLYDAWRRQMAVHEYLVFHPELEGVGRWHRQLMAESLGKERDGAPVGLTPTVSVGTTDFHSMLQLRLAGPKHAHTTFVWAENPGEDIEIGPAAYALEGVALSGRSYMEVVHTIRESVQASYREHGAPYSSIVLPDLSERALGALVMGEMAAVMMAGELMGVNAFDQPAVEGYKQKVRESLQ